MTEPQTAPAPDFRALTAELIDRLRADGVTPGIEVGEPAPSFALPNVRGELVSLDDRLADGPVVVSFYRGAWCPVCNMEMQALQHAVPDITAAGASLVAISPQAPDASRGFVEKLDLGFDVLSDVDQSVIRAYNLQFELPESLRDTYRSFGMALDEHNADKSWNLPVPATFVLDATGVVRARHVDPDYRQRMPAEEILAALRDMG